MRYLFVAAMWALPWMRTTLPYRYWRKVVAASQGVALVAGSTGFLPRVILVGVLAGALVLLAESFGRDVAWLWLRLEPVRVPVLSRPVLATRVLARSVLAWWVSGRRIEPAAAAGR
jgi:hypothetical protein